MPERISEHTQVRLADGVSVIQRGPSMVQFGLDATRTGVVETPQAEALNKLFDAPFQPRPIHKLTRQLVEVVGADAARSLVADLVAYRILVPTASAPALLLGDSALAASLAGLLGRGGVVVHPAPAHEITPEFLGFTEKWGPLVVADQLHRAVPLARLTRHREGAVVPVATVDSRVVIGPLRLDRAGACPACLAAYLAARDAGWRKACENYPGGPARPDPTVIAAGAAAAAVVVRRLAGLPDPPGVSAPAPRPGQLIVVDPFSPHPVTASTLPPHPDCPVCY